MKVLVLAYHYPPNSGSGTFRSLYFFNRIARSGDQVCVVTAREEDLPGGPGVDAGLCESIEPGIEVLRARVRRPLDWLLGVRERLRGGPPLGASAGGAPPAVHDSLATGGKSRFQAFKDLLTDALSFPDHHIGWLPAAYRCAAREIRSAAPDCIYSSGGPWTSHLIAILLKKRYGIPVVLDFRDPWAVNPDLAQRSALFRKLSYPLEAFCIRNADHVVLNTSPLREDFVARFPRESPGKFTMLTNGFEDQPVSEAAPDRKPPFTLVHAGEIYLSRNPAQFLRAVQILIQEGTIPAAQLRVQLVGGCSRNPEVDALLASDELKSAITLVPRVPHRKALEYQLGAHVLLLFQMGFPLQIPRKLFEYMSLSRPVLAITERTGATASLVRDSGVGVVAEPVADSIASALRALYRAWLDGGSAMIDQRALARYRNSQLAAELRTILHNAAGNRLVSEDAADGLRKIPK